MEFSPFNPVVKLCIQGMELEEKGLISEAAQIFEQAWNEAGNDFEKFLAAHYLARCQLSVANELNWLETALQFVTKLNTDAANSALPALHQKIARCYEALGDSDRAKEHSAISMSHQSNPTDKGPFYHGTRANLQVGDLLTAGSGSNYKDDLRMNHIYFTALVNGAGLAAALARGEGSERVYIVEPTGGFEHDPNLTDKKFPGNPSRSYRSAAPLKIVGEIVEWSRPKPEDLQRFREKLENNRGEIIN